MGLIDQHDSDAVSEFGSPNLAGFVPVSLESWTSNNASCSSASGNETWFSVLIFLLQKQTCLCFLFVFFLCGGMGGFADVH